MESQIQLQKGLSYPLGATVQQDPPGVNFCLFSKNAEAVELLLFDREDHRRPTHAIRLDPQVNKTFYYWHCFIPGLEHGQVYAYRVFGPYEPERGLLFDGQKTLLDPYARAVISETYDRKAASHPGDNCAQAFKGIVVDPDRYDWEEDRPLYIPFRQSVIYELHVGGFTKHPSSGLRAEWRGTYRGLVEKIPYLKALGVTAVELLPVQQFDTQDTPSGLPNYWGYAPVGFFAPHTDYGVSDDPLEVLDEFRDMVKALHREGIEVILDVVFNHTAENDLEGPTFSLRGIENRAYYMLEEGKPGEYKNFSGTGNTLNANHSIVRRMIRDCLRRWVSEMHVDGFRFDLASVLSRAEDGRPLENPPLLWEIESDPVLASTKIIAEAWDIEQYQLGRFIGDKWAEWNGKYRDDLRRFLKGDDGLVESVADRIIGSPKLFNDPKRNPSRSINFVTCHDGFTLNDLVAYNEKHNEANRENNQDGTDDNASWNCGVEGPTDDPEINALRRRQIKNFLTLLFISQGTPMLLMGDEVRRSQRGNNNAYCQDNEISWMDWGQVEREKDLLRFVQNLIGLNLANGLFHDRVYWNAPDNVHTTISWHGIAIGKPDWGYNSHTLAYTLHQHRYDFQLHVMINAFWEPLTFELPPLPKEDMKNWHCIINTALESPNDFFSPPEAPPIGQFQVLLKERSVLVAIARGDKP